MYVKVESSKIIVYYILAFDSRMRGENEREIDENNKIILKNIKSDKFCPL